MLYLPFCLKIKVEEIERSVYTLVGYSFAINSVQQLRKVCLYISVLKVLVTVHVRISIGIV